MVFENLISVFLYSLFLSSKIATWQDLISRLNRENGSLKQNLDATNAALSTARNEASKSSSNSINVLNVVS